MKIKKIKNNNGFTLIELMVATALFSIIMTMGMGSLVVSSNSAKASQKLRIAVDNVNFAMESMTREIRMGTLYYCANSSLVLSSSLSTQDCLLGSVPGNIIAFKPQQVSGAPIRVAYKQRSIHNDMKAPYSLERCELKSSVVCSDIVSLGINVEVLKFYVNGSTPPGTVPNDKIQPSVLILMQGTVTVKEVKVPFSIQSMASQRSSEVLQP